VVAGITLFLATALLLVFATDAGAGLFRLPPPPGQGPGSGSQDEPTCDPDPTADTPSDCTAITPPNDRAVIFDSYAATVADYPSNLANDRGEVAAVTAALKSENYMVSEDEGPKLWHQPLLSKFLAIAKQDPGVILISAHGYKPGATHRGCVAGRALIRAYGDHHPSAQLPPHERVSCAAGAGLIVEVDKTKAQMDKSYEAYRATGGSDEWAEPFAVDSANSYGLLLTTEGISHYFGHLHTALVIDDACHSMAFDDAFDAESYVGYTSTACDNENVVDIPAFFDRLAGESGIPARTTTGAFELGGFKSPVIDLAYVRPVVLSPAVVSASVQGSPTLEPGSSTPGSVTFDAAMDSANTTGVITASGCGATISDQAWNENATELSFDVNVPQNTTGGTLTLTVDHTQAIADPGGFPNQQLDGNQSPAAASGEAQNESDYSWQLPCLQPSYGTFQLSGNINATLQIASTVCDATTSLYGAGGDGYGESIGMAPAGQTPSPGDETNLALNLQQSGTTTFPDESAGDTNLQYSAGPGQPPTYTWYYDPGDSSLDSPSGSVTISADGSQGSVDLTLQPLGEPKSVATSDETIVGSWHYTICPTP
jgi:hypothetical protein